MSHTQHAQRYQTRNTEQTAPPPSHVTLIPQTAHQHTLLPPCGFSPVERSPRGAAQTWGPPRQQPGMHARATTNVSSLISSPLHLKPPADHFSLNVPLHPSCARLSCPASNISALLSLPAAHSVLYAPSLLSKRLSLFSLISLSFLLPTAFSLHSRHSSPSPTAYLRAPYPPSSIRPPG